MVTVGNERAPLLPEGMTHEVGACLGIAVMTAHRCVFADGPVAGQTILITGGAGRVGHYAIQWAHNAGARVIATASSDGKCAKLKELGADHVFNHEQEDVVKKVKELTWLNNMVCVVSLLSFLPMTKVWRLTVLSVIDLQNPS